jgi:hypothetical protein
MVLSFTIPAGPRQHSHSRFRVQRDPWPYFAVSDSRLFQPGDQVPVCISPRNKVAQLYLQALGSPLSLSLLLRSTIIRPVCLGIKHESGAYDHIFISVRQLRGCWCGALSLMRGRVCRLQLLLVLASAVILGSESRGTRGHILLSQIRYFPFRRLVSLIASRHGPRRNTPLLLLPLPHNGRCLQSHRLATGLYATIHINRHADK